MMNEQTELTGTVVLVHPNLLNDPFDKKNQVGVIISADLENDDVMVGFSDKSEGLFSTDALLVLKDVADIRRAAGYDFTLMPREDYYDIMEVCVMAELSGYSGRRMAVELSRESPMAQEYTMQRLDEALGRNHHKHPGR